MKVVLRKLLFIIILGISNAQIKTRITPSSFRVDYGSQSQQVHEQENINTYKQVDSSSLNSGYNHQRGDQNERIEPYPYLNSNNGHPHLNDSNQNNFGQQNLPIYNQNSSHAHGSNTLESNQHHHVPQSTFQQPSNGHAQTYDRVEGREQISGHWQFENRTVQSIQPGICYKEVE